MDHYVLRTGNACMPAFHGLIVIVQHERVLCIYSIKNNNWHAAIEVETVE